MHTLKKTFFRPNIDINLMTGITLIAVPTTIVATGKVDKLLIGERPLPIMPATKTIKTLRDMNRDWQAVKIHTFFGRLNIWLSPMK